MNLKALYQTKIPQNKLRFINKIHYVGGWDSKSGLRATTGV
jgi:hypothetical protein